MSKWKPAIFVGSSKESKPVAIAFMRTIANGGIARPIGWWNAGEFKPLSDTLSALLEASENYDYGLFILGKDDFTVSRDTNFLTPRDNVFVEMGIFLGKLGPDRVLAAVYEPAPGEPPLKTPSDFAGRHIPRFRYGNEDEMRTSVDIAAEELNAVLKDWSPEQPIPLLRGYSHEPGSSKFIFGINTRALYKRKKRIGDRCLLPVVLKDDAEHPWPVNPVIAVGEMHAISEFELRKLDLTVNSPPFQRQIKEGDRIEFRLFLAPSGAKPGAAKTINELFENGCVFVDGASMAARGEP